VLARLCGAPDLITLGSKFDGTNGARLVDEITRPAPS
jgi:hypothetical protein